MSMYHLVYQGVQGTGAVPLRSYVHTIYEVSSIGICMIVRISGYMTSGTRYHVKYPYRYHTFHHILRMDIIRVCTYSSIR